MANFSDDFSTFAPDYTKWGTSAVGVSQTDAGLVIPCTFGDGQLTGASTTDVTGSAVYTRVDQMAGGISGASTFALLRGTDSFRLDFQVVNGTLSARHVPAAGGAAVVAASATYNPVTHQWLQIREAGGTIFWETSTNGSTWVAFANWARGAEAVTALKPFFECGYTDNTPGRQGTGQMVVRFYNQTALRDRSPGVLTETFDALPVGTLLVNTSYRDWRTIDDGGGAYVTIASGNFLQLNPPAGVDVTVRDDLRHPPATIDLTFTMTIVSEVGTNSNTVIHWGLPVGSNAVYPRYEVVISHTTNLIYAQQRFDASTTQSIGVAPLTINTALNQAYRYRLQAIGPNWTLSRDQGPGTPVARLLTGTMPSNIGIGHIGFTAFQARAQVDTLQIAAGVPIDVELAGPPIAQRGWGAFAVANTPGTPVVDPSVSDEWTTVPLMFRRIGGAPEIASWYAAADWSSTPDAAAQWASSGLQNMVAWLLASPMTASGIQGGSIDAQMLALCAAIDAQPTLTWIRLGPKMNVSTSPVRGVATTAASYISMWRYIVGFMRGLTSKVRFIFNPARMESPITDPPLELYFPGDAYVDAVGFDAYNFGNDGGAGAHSWETHAQAFRLIYDRLRALSTKDIWVCEISSKEPLASDAYTTDVSGNYTVAVPTGTASAPVDTGHSKGQWIRDLLNETSFPRITTINWYSAAAARDWRYDSSADALAGFMDGFQTTAPGERVVLDPSEMSDNASFDITAFVASAGPDWGDAVIQQIVADAGVEGQIPIDFTIPNRTITVPLALQDRAGVAFHDARLFLQQKVALFMAQGGWIKRHTTWGDVYAEIVNAQLKLGGSTMQATLDVDTDAQLVLTTLPAWLGREQDLGTVNGFGEVDIVTDNPIDGNHPGRMRIVVTDTSGSDQLGVLWAVRARNLIDPTLGTVAATNQIAYEAEDLTPSGTASRQTLAGASGPLGQVVKFLFVPRTTDQWNPVWQGVLATTLATGFDLTHVGSQRVYARAYIEGGAQGTLSTTRLRFRAEVGDLLLGAANAATDILKFGDFYVLDLGVIRLDEAPVGNHRWQGHVEAMNLTGNESVSIDKLWVIPVQEGAGALRALDPNLLYDGRQVLDAVVFANQIAELRTDGLYRLSRSGAGYGPIQRPQGPLPKLPASGMEQRPVEIFVKTSRGTLDESVADAGIDPLTIDVVYQASFSVRRLRRNRCRTLIANFSYSTVLTPPSPAASGLSLTVRSGDGSVFPLPPFNAIVCPVGQAALIGNAEIIRVTGAAGDTLTIVRTQEGSNARAIQAGDQIYAAITAKVLSDAEALTPIGSIQMYGGGVAPANFLFCDGTQYLNSDYPALAAVLGTTYGGDATHFNVPDMKGRVPIGVGTGAGLAARSRGAKGGGENHAHPISGVSVSVGLPDHTHYIGDHVHALNNAGGATIALTDDFGVVMYTAPNEYGGGGGPQFSPSRSYGAGTANGWGTWPGSPTKATSPLVGTTAGMSGGYTSIGTSGVIGGAGSAGGAANGNTSNAAADAAMPPFVALNHIIRAR